MKPLLFSGIEIEGRHKGKKTLFVQGRVSYNEIVAVLNGMNYEQVYFGAKYKDFSIQPSEVDFSTVLRLMELFKTPIFTIEREGFSGIPETISNLEFIIVVRYVNHIFDLVMHESICKHIQVKLFSNNKNGVILIPGEALDFTHKDAYAKDELVLV